MAGSIIKLLGYNVISGQIRCLTGLRIGAGKEIVEIGGLDNPVIKHPLTKLPYIPGSSLKGKMRSLLELKLGKVDTDGRPHGRGPTCGLECPVCRIFGVAAGGESPFGPGRLVVRDANPSIGNGRSATDSLKTEIKFENTINRIKGAAENPRQTERVPAGAVFDFEMSYRVFDVDEDQGHQDEDLFQNVLNCLRMVELDALGGSGSRGYGRVAFDNVVVRYRDGREEAVSVSALVP